MINLPFALIWAAIVGAAVAVEAVALKRPERGDTFSEIIWWIASKSLALKGVLAAFIIWLFLHLVFMVA